MIHLAVNIDHVATVRNARGGMQPDPIEAARQSIQAGAVGIVCHLREDRRHIRDADVYALRRELNTKLDLEMAAHEEIIRIAEDVKPELVTIVPEKREELTTEGGLNIAADPLRYAELVQRMHALGIEVSFFIEPDSKQIETAHKIGADIIELHTLQDMVSTIIISLQSKQYPVWWKSASVMRSSQELFLQVFRRQ